MTSLFITLKSGFSPRSVFTGRRIYNESTREKQQFQSTMTGQTPYYTYRVSYALLNIQHEAHSCPNFSLCQVSTLKSISAL
jgi:hypothetical protein